MDYRRPLAFVLILFGAGAYAQSTAKPDSLSSRLPGSEAQSHFQFEHHDSVASRWPANLGQSVARIIAHKHKMGGDTLVQYSPPSPECKVRPSKPECPLYMGVVTIRPSCHRRDPIGWGTARSTGVPCRAVIQPSAFLHVRMLVRVGAGSLNLRGRWWRLCN